MSKDNVAETFIVQGKTVGAEEFKAAKPGTLTLNTGTGNGFEGLEIALQAEGHMMVNGRKVDTDEGMRDALIEFIAWTRKVAEEGNVTGGGS